jgi:uncharacterized protein YgiM (DUF1202 family)
MLFKRIKVAVIAAMAFALVLGMGFTVYASDRPSFTVQAEIPLHDWGTLFASERYTKDANEPAMYMFPVGTKIAIETSFKEGLTPIAFFIVGANTGSVGGDNTFELEITAAMVDHIIYPLWFYFNPDEEVWFDLELDIYFKAGGTGSAPSSPTTPTTPTVITPPAAPLFNTALPYVAANAINVRSSASLTATAIGFIPRGEAVNVLARTGNWYRIQFGTQTGYVSALHVVQPNTMNTANTTPRVVNTTALNVRSGMGMSHTIIAIVRSGETVYEIERIGGWSKIAWFGRVAYVSSSFLR